MTVVSGAVVVMTTTGTVAGNLFSVVVLCLSESVDGMVLVMTVGSVGRTGSTGYSENSSLVLMIVHKNSAQQTVTVTGIRR